MKISPLDVKKQEFAKQFRGYSPSEVHSYLEMVADELEEVLKKNLELEEKIKAMETELANYKRIEDVLQETLLTTQKSAEETKSTAEKKAQAIVNEAQLHADRLVADAREKLLDIQRQIADLKSERDAFLINFKSLLDTQRSLLEIIEKKANQKDRYAPIRKKTDLSDEELERIIGEFENGAGQQKGETVDSDHPIGFA